MCIIIHWNEKVRHTNSLFFNPKLDFCFLYMQADRIERDAEQREQRLQATAAAATMQVDEFRSALAKVERERDKLLAEKKDRDRAAEAAAAAVAAAKRYTIHLFCIIIIHITLTFYSNSLCVYISYKSMQAWGWGQFK